MSVLQDIQQLNAGNIITLYELDLTSCIGKFGQTPYVALGGATVGSITPKATGWEAQITGLADTSTIGIGSKLTSFSPGSGRLYQAVPNNCVVISIDSETSLTYKTYGGQAPIAGTVANIIGLTCFTWCDGVNEIGGEVTFDSIRYSRYPIQATGFDKTGNGTIPRPKLTMGNIGGIVGALAKDYNDLVGAKLTRTRTFARYLDTVNFKKYNVLLHTNSMLNPVWAPYSTGGATGTVELVKDPVYGYVLRIKKLTGAVGTRFGVRQAFSGLTGNQYNVFTYVRPIISESSGYAFYVDANRSIGGLSTRTFPLAGLDTLNVWKKCSATSAISDLTGTGSFYMWVEGPPGSTIDFAWPQLSSGAEVYEYQPTGASWNPTADPTQILDKEIWTVDRKSNENSIFMEWELTAPFDLRGVKIPRRQCVQNMCNWKYRGPECGYTGTAYFDIKDGQVLDPSRDICGKRLSSCKKRFGATAVLPYGGFPAVGI